MRGEDGANSSVIKFSKNTVSVNTAVKDWVIAQVEASLEEMQNGQYPAFVYLL